ncbi:MAG: hypothetical protein M0011_15030 [Elusimicrobia bacterium]|nr:hypothetical protein [Elusimicrobiota bacterium]
MTADRLDHLIGTAAGFGVAAFFIYRRFRRNFGRQRLKRGTLKLRVAIFCSAGLLILASTLHSIAAALAALAGLGAGLGIAFAAARHTRFEERDGELYYVPHTYAGLAVSALFLGRLLYRLVSGLSAPAPSSAVLYKTSAFGSVAFNPATMAIFFILVGYYVYFYSYLLLRSGRLTAEDLESRAAAGGKGI